MAETSGYPGPSIIGPLAFAQLTYRESLRDIETCLSAQASKLYAMGFRDPVRRSTLADANEGRDWRIYAELAQRLIAQARELYLGEDLGFDLANTVYALDSTTIDLCLAVFPWAHFRTAKAAVKICVEISRALSIYPTASSTTSTHSICYSPRLAPSMSWIAATSKAKRLALTHRPWGTSADRGSKSGRRHHRRKGKPPPVISLD